MGAFWLTGIAARLAADPDLTFRTWPGYEKRARSSGGFDKIMGVVAHHTADGSWGHDRCCQYLYEQSADKPIGNFCLGRDGTITLGAAGASNCQGKGGPVTCSKGTVPLDQGNRNMIAIEAQNNGTGEPWPDAQLKAYVRLVAHLCEEYGLDPARDIFTHAGWCQPSCPGRKIDPAGPTPLYPQLGGLFWARSWPQAEFRKLVAADIEARKPKPVPEDGLPDAPLFLGSSGPQVVALIELLKAFRWYPAEWLSDRNDGKFGARTEAGVRAMQLAFGLASTGIYGEIEVAALVALRAYLAALGG